MHVCIYLYARLHISMHIFTHTFIYLSVCLYIHLFSTQNVFFKPSEHTIFANLTFPRDSLGSELIRTIEPTVIHRLQELQILFTGSPFLKLYLSFFSLIPPFLNFICYSSLRTNFRRFLL